MSKRRKMLVDLSDRQLRRIIAQENDVRLLTNANIANTNHEEIMQQAETSHMTLDTEVASPDMFIPEESSSICSNSTSTTNTENSVSSTGCHDAYVPISTVKSLKNDLAVWAVNHKIPQVALTSLLQTLKEHLPSEVSELLPNDARCVLKTPRATVVQSIEPGQYFHIGIKYGIEKFLGSHVSKNIELQINIDGLPLSESNSSQLWPILGNVHPGKDVFLIGAYHGYSKPHDANKFLEYFVKDAQELLENGLEYKGEHVNVKLRCIICDAPAKSFIMKIKGHTGYHSCTKCTQEGEYQKGRVCFPEISFTKRSDESFIAQTDEDYHLGTSILTDIPNIGLVTQIPLDYMHLICIGVVKKIINLWLSGPNLKVRLQHRKVSLISERLLSLRSYIPSKFARRPQEIENISKWKATELRQFLLYTSPIILHQIQSTVIYEHFLTLHVACRILCGKNCNDDKLKLSYAQKLLEHFVQSFSLIYGSELISHNVHGLLHLAEDVDHLGALDSFSAFPFENFLKTLKSLIRKHEKPLQQLHRRYVEASQTTTNLKRASRIHCTVSNMHRDGPIMEGYFSQNQYKILEISGWKLSVEKPDNCCMINFKLILIHNFLQMSDGRYFVLGKQLMNLTHIYSKPCLSSQIDCFWANEVDKKLQMWDVSQINAKCMMLPFNDGFAIFPLLHCD
ncbi:unnamed protein product [Callosobruchus maculatus]|uniref:Transposase domain-containing protein n=1 Tax=Callosobruchus maculatus TaxID=64391 RepID=A0A653BNW8_CALMS|nr:unnamed protein product [Callosobruchus maculatus]